MKGACVCVCVCTCKQVRDVASAKGPHDLNEHQQDTEGNKNAESILKCSKHLK